MNFNFTSTKVATLSLISVPNFLGSNLAHASAVLHKISKKIAIKIMLLNAHINNLLLLLFMFCKLIKIIICLS